ncbi:MAG: LysR family transcriptional regulator [Coriobacteriales bacterium]
MDVSIMREFITFARVLSVTKAARELNVSTSTLSRHLCALESELGAQLFTRDQRLSLTGAGKMALDSSSVIVAEYDRLLSGIRGLASSGIADVRVSYALDDRTSIDVISRSFAELRPRLHGAIVRSVQPRSKQIARALADREVDVAVLFVPSVLDAEDFEAIPFSTDRALVALPASEGMSADAPVTLAEVSGRTIPWPSSARDDYLDRLLTMFDGMARKPTVRWVDADDMDAFFMRSLEPGDMWFFSENQFRRYEGSIPASFRSTVTLHEIIGADATLVRNAVCRRDNPNPAAKMLARQMGELGMAEGGRE